MARADERFYQNHPEMIAGGRRAPIDPRTQPLLAEEWRRLYHAELPGQALAREQPAVPGDVVAACPTTPDHPDDYLHVFVLVPGTTQPVNDLFSFISDSHHANAAGRSYWADGFIAGLEQLKREADTANAGDPHYHSDCDWDFSWSGANNLDQRESAGRMLIARLWNDYKVWRAKLVYFHLIAHSHGGNVINDCTAALSSDDPRIHFGERWFIKSITYLSTPFFQKIEQPHGMRVYGSAVIYNVRNHFDLTQLTIADFTIVMGAGDILGRLAARVAPVRAGLAALTGDLPRFRDAFLAVPSARVRYEAERVRNAVPFVNNDAAEAAALRALDAARAKLRTEAQTLKQDIAELCTAIDGLLEELTGVLRNARNGGNQQQVDALQESLASARIAIAGVQQTSSRLVEMAAAYAFADLLGALLGVLVALLEILADLVRDDRWLRIIVLGALHIIEMFDDTLQDNQHYAGLAGRDHRLRAVEAEDGYQGFAPFGRLRAELLPRERSLHDSWRNARTVAAFRRLK